MANPRFFVPIDSTLLDQALSDNAGVTLPPEAAHHAGRALRLRNGETVTLFNGDGAQWDGTIAFDTKKATVTVTGKSTPAVESPVAVTLVQALVSPDKLDWIIEKAVECGVTRIILTPAERSVTRWTADRVQKRLVKCQSIAVSAAEQCGRNVVPSIEAAPSYDAAIEQTRAALRLLLAPGATPADALPDTVTDIAVAVGPEGGFSEREIAQARDAGWLPVLLGPRVLRTETAGLVACAWINTRWGDY